MVEIVIPSSGSCALRVRRRGKDCKDRAVAGTAVLQTDSCVLSGANRVPGQQPHRLGVKGVATGQREAISATSRTCACMRASEDNPCSMLLPEWFTIPKLETVQHTEFSVDHAKAMLPEPFRTPDLGTGRASFATSDKAGSLGRGRQVLVGR